MREILFRGKTYDGEWVEGFLFNSQLCRIFWATAFKKEEDNMFYCEGKDVNPETIGQFTGLTDKNGTKIFEGDIVRFFDKDWKEGGIATVDYEYGKWKINGQYTTKISSIVWRDLYRSDFEYEVIGNIHDNPELLEVQNER